MSLRKGKAKYILESSIDCVLLAVEIYNKPRAKFKVQCFVTQMIIGWTRLFHAYFHKNNSGNYFYKQPNGKFVLVDKERKAWDLKQCIKEYGKLNDAVIKNLEFFIRLRNKIEHRNFEDSDIGIKIFGECQSLLLNYENLITKLFGEQYSINESLTYSLQFSRIRTNEQKNANKQLLSSEVKNVIQYIEKFRNEISQEVYDSEEFSIKLLLIPKISNTKRNDLSIEYVKLEKGKEEDKEIYNQMTVLVKEKIVRIESKNYGLLKPGKVIKLTNSKSKQLINQNDHKLINSIFNIRQYKSEVDDFDPLKTNTKYCIYDEAHNDYLYNENWVSFLVKNLNNGKLTKELWKSTYKDKKKIDIRDYE